MLQRLKDWLRERRIERLKRRLAVSWTTNGGYHDTTQTLYARLVAECKARSAAKVARMHAAIIAKARR